MKRKALETTILILFLTQIICYTAYADNMSISFDPEQNYPPYKPINPNPSNGSIVRRTYVYLRVDVYDPNGGTVDVYFYNANTSKLIGKNKNIPVDDWSTAEIYLPGLKDNKTIYWYVIVKDEVNSNQSPIWHFKVDLPEWQPSPSPPLLENIPPIADADGPYNGTVNQSITFNASKSYDPDGTIIGYRWDFNNDTLWDTGWLTLPTINYTYPAEGNYTIVLQVKDNDGSTDTDTTRATINKTINVTEEKKPPIPIIEAPNITTTNQTITINGSKSIDPDGQIINYTWNLGDGNISYGKTINHTYTKPGIYNITLTVTDNQGINISTTKTIIVVEKPPTGKPTRRKPLPLPITVVMALILLTAAITIIIVSRRFYRKKNKKKKQHRKTKAKKKKKRKSKRSQKK